MNLVAMNRETFQALSDERLGWACMEPTFEQIRGKSPALKEEVISRLTQGQKALCMFLVLYGHSYKSAEEYYAWISYMLDIPGYWNSVMEGVRFFDESGTGTLLDETRERLEARNQRLDKRWGDATLMDMERDAGLREMVDGWYIRFKQAAPVTLGMIADYIRANPDEFVVLND